VRSSRKGTKQTSKPRAAAVATILQVANERAGNNIAQIIAELQAGGAISLQDIAAGLNQRGITTARGGTWSAKQVARVLARRTATKQTAKLI
jgi:ribosomal protein L18